MKILIAHNSYRLRGGEDMVAETEIELLRSRGHTVECYRQSNDDIQDMSGASVAMASLWAQKSASEIGRLCDSFRPDLIHAHNTFPLISPSLYWLAAKRRTPMVQTLHNFRLLCPQAMFLRDGKACEDCLATVPWRAVTRKCYRGSTVQSGVVAGMLMLHRLIGSYRDKVTSYIALSKFSRDKFIAGGLPAERIHIKPNFVERQLTPEWKGRKGGLFVGRLSSEKGLNILIEAAEKLANSPVHNDAPLCIRVVGAGPMEELVTECFKGDYLGPKSSADVFNLLRSALFVIVPSTCYETFGLIAVEAFSCGVPVIASGHGGLGELITDGVTGLLFKPGDASDLARKIAWAHEHASEMLRMGQAAYVEYLHKYTPSENYKMLMNIYNNAVYATHGRVYAK
jgi:glycosyltransferase involved in cell wall biosynthesis